MKLEEMECDAICEALQKTRGNKSRAAKLLGISRDGLHRKIKRLGILKKHPYHPKT